MASALGWAAVWVMTIRGEPAMLPLLTPPSENAPVLPTLARTVLLLSFHSVRSALWLAAPLTVNGTWLALSLVMATGPLALMLPSIVSTPPSTTGTTAHSDAE